MKRHENRRRRYPPAMADDRPQDIVWMSTQEAARRLGITPRTLYRFVDEDLIPGYKMGRVFRFQQRDVDAFIERSRIAPGSLEHLYPERRTASTEDDGT
jgi:excisionase family DNA binding protein